MAVLGSTTINGNLQVNGTLQADSVTVDDIDSVNMDGANNVITSFYGHSLSFDTATSTLTLLNANNAQIEGTSGIIIRDTLQAITTNGATTDKVISITNNTGIVNSSATSGALNVTGGIYVSSGIKVSGNVYTVGNVYAAAVYSAVWNDYAEYREAGYCTPGDVVTEVGDGTLELSYKRLLPASWVVSDTFGFATGETEKAQTPVATCGRVLVKLLEDRNICKVGDCVCSAPGGHASIMTRDELISHPEAIIGIVCSIPEEGICEYGVKVNNRVWIKVK